MLCYLYDIDVPFNGGSYTTGKHEQFAIPFKILTRDHIHADESIYFYEFCEF